MIHKKLIVGPLATNCYIVGSESSREGVIIDPGNEAKKILIAVKDLALDIKFILLTHGHCDHIGALKEVREAIGAEVAMHKDDAVRLQEYSLLGKQFDLYCPAPSSPDRLLQDGDSIDVGDLHFSVLHTPGHTPGGICLLVNGVVFSGDTLFHYSVGRCDLPGSSSSQLMNSIHTKLMTLPDNTIVYPGHGPSTTIGAERRDNPFISF